MAGNFIVYKITNLINGKIYIGQTVRTLEQRKAQHISNAMEKYQYTIQRAIRKYGKDNFVFETLFHCLSKEELNQKEIETIQLLNSKAPIGYNLTDGGEGNLGNKYRLGIKHTPETLAKMSVTRLGRKRKKFSDEWRANISKGRLGQKPTDETRTKLRIMRKGRKPNLGHKHTAELRAKWSADRKGKKYRLGTKATTETKAKISLALKGNHYALGYKHTNETKAKDSAIMILRWQRKREMAGLERS